MITVIFLPCRCIGTVGDSIVWGKEHSHLSLKEIWNFSKHVTLMSGTWNGGMNIGSLFWIIFSFIYSVQSCFVTSLFILPVYSTSLTFGSGRENKKFLELILLQSYIHKNILVHFEFITNWNEGVVLCSPCVMHITSWLYPKVK